VSDFAGIRRDAVHAARAARECVDLVGDALDEALNPTTSR
jgi:hypothetical protein